MHISINNFNFKHLAAKNVTKIVEVNLIQQKSERFYSVYCKLWWKNHHLFIHVLHFLGLTKPKNALNVCSKKNGSQVGAYVKHSMLIFLITTQKSYACDNDANYDVIMQEPVSKLRHNHMKSAGIWLLNYYSFRPTQPFSFWDKSTLPRLPFVVLAL